jgi:glutamyl-tRNA synthetase
VRGPYVQRVAQEVGDFVLRRADGAWAYQLAVVVDDAAMQIDSVVRGADLLDSTPRQILLQRTLGVPTPTYGHVPLILGPAGAKLSKRDGAPDVSALREGGVAPEVVISALARSLGLVGPQVRAVRASELVDGFALERVGDGAPLDSEPDVRRRPRPHEAAVGPLRVEGAEPLQRRSKPMQRPNLTLTALCLLLACRPEAAKPPAGRRW